MPRRNRPGRPKRAQPGIRPMGAGFGFAQVEAGPDGDWMVRTVPAAQATKLYRCPGCDHEIRPGVGHVVAWPADDYGSVEDRRHWHTGCWRGRRRQGPSRR
ncbi:hypothetical protein [Haloactinomyces albus]|uniref:ATP/GTP-binding protein n=1 Tax=Haloactinomyces albus TaxID=1352928 RepID=A0AAE3ZA29_9ACTN|nr:hypothetical protein [Haloactinomyces albus]MDR7301113.1 hypothetical protein [Haloactinomyces albus]